MFYVNTRDLDKDFFTSKAVASAGWFSYEQLFENRTPRPLSTYAKMYGSWVLGSIMPALNTSNPDTGFTLSSVTSSQANLRGNTDIHLDDESSTTRPDGVDQLYVNLGLLPHGVRTSGTMFPISLGLCTSDGEVFLDSFSSEEIERDFETAPQGYAALFDPHREFHAAPPPCDDRVLYQAIINVEYVDRTYEPLTVPDSDIFIRPYSLEN